MEAQIFVTGARGNWKAALKIGVQTFYVCERSTKKEAMWYCKMLKIALTNLMDANLIELLGVLKTKLHTDDQVEGPGRYHPESIMEYDRICNHDEGYLCEHRRKWILDFLEKQMKPSAKIKILQKKPDNAL